MLLTLPCFEDQLNQPYALGANVENLTLTGTAINGTGNDLNNLMTGNASANRLSGGNGSDTLAGGAGMSQQIATLLGANALSAAGFFLIQ